jgi:polyribonucleotide nucleotidyltransferase
MASVCGGSLALMDAAVPIKEHAAGISIGLVKEKEEYTLLTDITGLEDDFGDMDFKIAGTKNGITAIQLDTKIKDLTLDIIGSALSQAREVRHKILEIMNSTICKPRESISPYAPKVSIFYINPDKIKNLIGRGGKTIKEIADTTNAFIDIEDDGKVIVFAPTEQNLNQALDMIEYHTAEVEIGKVYKGRVLRVVRFGAFVEILPGVEGLVHISQLDTKYITSAEEVVKEGDIIKVLVIDIDEKGRISLSRKATLTQK